MSRRPLYALAAALSSLAVGLPTGSVSAAEVQPDLALKLATAAPDELLRVYVLLDAQLDGPTTLREVADLRLRERRARVINQLKSLARDRQAPVLAELDALRPAGDVGEVTSLWIANALIAELNPATIRRLAADSAVRSIHEVRRYAPGEATDDLPTPPMDPSRIEAIEPNISLIKAPDLWGKGYAGQSKIVGNIDTGTDTTHPDLAAHIWQNIDETVNGQDSDGNGFIDDVIGWDFEQNDNDPTPGGSSHGTNTAGIVVGDGTEGRQTGVAPKGYIMILKACGESPAMQAVQYAVDNGADAITSSCSYKFPNRPFYDMWRQISENTMLAGVPHANSIGNQGQQLGSHPIPYNISAPGLTPSAWNPPEQTILGGLGALVATGGVQINLNPYNPSGHGPSAWEDIQVNYPTQRFIPSQYWDYPWSNGTQQGLLKPEIVMPTNVFTTRIGTGYTSFGGTSAATPHTGGSLALLLSAAPSSTPADLSEALQSFTTDLGTPGKDNDFGSGLPNLADAAQSLMPEVTPIAEPYGQTVNAGDILLFQFQWINNTNTQMTVWRRVDFHYNGTTETVAGPGDITIPAGGAISINWDYGGTADLNATLIEVELVIEDAPGGNVISSTSVDAYVR